MTRMHLAAAVFFSPTLFLSVPARAQIAPAIPRAESLVPSTPPDAPPTAATIAPPDAAVSPAPYTPAPPAAAPPAVVVAATPPPSALADMTDALGFGVGIIPNAELAGTTGAVAIKYWLSDALALAPLFSFAYDKPTGVGAAWHLRPEAVLLFVPFASRWTRFEVGGGLGFGVSKVSTPSADGMTLQPDAVFTLALPIQAGVEHFFTRWLSLGIAARADLFAYSQQGSYHEVSFAIDSTSLLAQLFFYTD